MTTTTAMLMAVLTEMAAEEPKNPSSAKSAELCLRRRSPSLPSLALPPLSNSLSYRIQAEKFVGRELIQGLGHCGQWEVRCCNVMILHLEGEK